MYSIDKPAGHGMLKKAIVTTVDLCTRYARQVIGLAVLLAIVSGIYAASHFAIDADVNKLISKDLPWRQREARIRQIFPAEGRDHPGGHRCAHLRTGLPGHRGPDRRSCPARRTSSTRSWRPGAGRSSRRTGCCSCRPRRWSTLTKKLGEAKPVHPGAGPGLQSARPDDGPELRVDRRADEPLHARRPCRDAQHGRRHHRRGRSPGARRASPGARCSTAGRRRRASGGASSKSGRFSISAR